MHRCLCLSPVIGSGSKGSLGQEGPKADDSWFVHTALKFDEVKTAGIRV
jgi:hypothetical protein